MSRISGSDVWGNTIEFYVVGHTHTGAPTLKLCENYMCHRDTLESRRSKEERQFHPEFIRACLKKTYGDDIDALQRELCEKYRGHYDAEKVYRARKLRNGKYQVSIGGFLAGQPPDKYTLEAEKKEAKEK